MAPTALAAPAASAAPVAKTISKSQAVRDSAPKKRGRAPADMETPGQLLDAMEVIKPLVAKHGVQKIQKIAELVH